MKTILLFLISFQLWRTQDSKPTKPCGLGAHPPKQHINKTMTKHVDTAKKSTGKLVTENRRMEAFNTFPAWKQMPRATAALPYGEVAKAPESTATTTSRILLDNDCDYVNYYCMRGFYTGNVCAKTVYQTYETFAHVCEMEYINCMEQYDMWSIAHMGKCYNVTHFQTFAYYAYAVWDGEQLEEMYVMPNA